MDRRFIDWIWHVRGSVELAPGQSTDEAFERLDPLFRQPSTSHERTSNTLTFRKKDPAAQDKMAVFDNGVLEVRKGGTGSVLHYHLTSRILLFCFLAPLLFIGFGQLTIVLGKIDPPTKAEEKSDKAKDGSKKAKEKDKALPQHPIDKALGAPAPKKPKKEDKKPSPTPAYVFAALFAILYVIGRILEDRLIKARFKKKLAG